MLDSIARNISFFSCH